MPRIVYLTAEIVSEINRRVVRRTGEVAFLRDPNRLVSALTRPEAAAHYAGATLLPQAALLVEGLARAQAFEQGNKRTALHAGLLFLQVNGYVIRAQELEFAQHIEL